MSAYKNPLQSRPLLWGQFVLAFSISLWFLRNHFPSPIQFKSDTIDYVVGAENFWGISVGGAENFWGIPGRLFHTNLDAWDAYLSIIPFRQIGVGTFEIIVRRFFPTNELVALHFFLTTILAASYAALATACHRILNPIVGAICLYLLLFTTNAWASGTYLMTEPFVRILLTFCLAVSIWPASTEGFTPVLKTVFLLALCLMLVHIKAQWILLGVALPLFLLPPLFRERRIKDFLIGVTLTAAIPLSLLLVNLVGWGYPGLAGGGSLHYMHRPETGESFLKAACADPEIASLSPRFCRDNKFVFSWWDVVYYEYPGPNFRKILIGLDKFTPKAIDKSPKAIWRTVVQGTFEMTNFPNQNRTGYLQFIDLSAMGLCFAGLALRKLRLACTVALVSWADPILARHLAMWDSRYLTPMAGLPLIVGLLVILQFVAERRSMIIGLGRERLMLRTGREAGGKTSPLEEGKKA